MHAFPETETRRLLSDALAEDVGHGDLTTMAVVKPGTTAVAELVAKETLVLAGLPGFKLAFEVLNPKAGIAWREFHADGDSVGPGTLILAAEGDAATLLTGERTALNLLQRLSGIATKTAKWQARLAGTNARLVDTRKTTPGLRALEKYAVRVGGGTNHRFGLFDGILIKENHIRAAGSITVAARAARLFAPHTIKVEVEVTSLDEVKEALTVGADILLLDNMTTEMMAEAVKIAEGRALLEASGNMTEERLAEVAATGVDLISAGALTHSARAVDLSLLFKI